MRTEQMIAHVSWQLAQEGFAPVHLPDDSGFGRGFVAGKCLLLFVQTPDPSVEQVRSWVEQAYAKLPKGISLVVLATFFQQGLSPELQAYLGKARKSSFLNRSVTAIAVDEENQKWAGRLDPLESGGLSRALTQALKSFNPEDSYDLEELARREQVLLEQTREAAQELLRVKPYVTYATMAACVLVFGWMSLSGGTQDSWTLLRFGANFTPLDKLGQIWRWGSAMFIHIGLIHLVVNLYALFSVGPSLERLLGNRAFAGLYAISGLAGGLISTYYGKGGLSAGASGAIFGLFGAGLWIDRNWKKELPGPLRQALVGGMGPTILYNLIIGFSTSFIDNAAHLGGLLGGLLFMFLISPLGARRLRALGSLWVAPGLIPLACLAWALAQAVRYPTPASYPARPVETAKSPYVIQLPLFLVAKNVDGQPGFVGPGYVWINNAIKLGPREKPPDFKDSAQAEQFAKELGEQGKQKIASHEVVKASGYDWLLVKIEYPENRLGYMAVRVDGSNGFLPRLITVHEQETAARELFVKCLDSVQLKPGY